MSTSDTTSYTINGDGYSLTVTGESIPVGAIVQGIIDATLGTGDALTIRRVK